MIMRDKHSLIPLSSSGCLGVKSLTRSGIRPSWTHMLWHFWFCTFRHDFWFGFFSGIAEVTSSSPDFFRLLLSNCLNRKINSSLSSTTAVQIWIISYTLHIISLRTDGRYELNKLTSLSMCGFIAQLVEHRTGIAEPSHRFESRWSPDFFQASSLQLLKLEN